MDQGDLLERVAERESDPLSTRRQSVERWDVLGEDKGARYGKVIADTSPVALAFIKARHAKEGCCGEECHCGC